MLSFLRNLLHLRQNAITFRTLLHLVPFITFGHSTRAELLVISHKRIHVYKVYSQGHPKRVSSQIHLIHFFVIQSIFRPLEMHSKWCYKIYICSVILRELECFRN